MKPSAAVIIPHLNDEERLMRCLNALMPQVRDRAEVIVVDNGSSESIDALEDMYADVRFVTEDRKGAANSRNRGAEETDAEHLFFLDCDCIPSSNWLDTALSIASHADLIGGEVAVFDETPPPRSGAEAFETVFAFKNQDYVHKKGFTVTANLLTNRRVFNSVGGFRDGLSEDLEWCRRATSAGFTLSYSSALRVHHPTRSNWAELERKWLRLTRESWALKERSFRARVFWALRALAMPISVVVHTPTILWSVKLSSSLERRRAFVTLLHIRVCRCIWMLRQTAGSPL